jgi:predicted lipoprotein with Yx(FWY)xxD motif
MKLILTCLALTAALLLAACGDDSPDTVSLDDGLLVDSTGAPLYTSEQEQSGKIACTGGCASTWLPLAAPSSGQPTAGSDVSGELGVVTRPNGSRQVTLDGRPLYRFAQDGEAGKATGDGLTDSFDGRRFTWHVEGSSAASSAGDGENGGRYNY